MTTIEQQEVVALVREQPQKIELSQAKFAALLNLWFHSVKRWENQQTPSFLLGLNPIETPLHQRGKGKSLLARHFEARESQQ